MAMHHMHLSVQALRSGRLRKHQTIAVVLILPNTLWMIDKVIKVLTVPGGAAASSNKVGGDTTRTGDCGTAKKQLININLKCAPGCFMSA
jgi:hypothetical protein